jgi:transcriptional regulator with XRE-family HTH domain
VVSTRRDPGHTGRSIAARLRVDFGRELRTARIGAGLSQQAIGDAVAISHAQVSRIERGLLPSLAIDQACRLGQAVGLRVSLRTFPDGDPLRDASQLALLDRFRARLPAAARWATEVPLPIPGDRRAWDGLASLGGRRAGCEAETRIQDLQSLERRLALKLRDGAVDVLILAVADTASNRAALRMHRDELRTLLPLDGRQILAAFGAGRLPDASGLILL